MARGWVTATLVVIDTPSGTLVLLKPLPGDRPVLDRFALADMLGTVNAEELATVAVHAIRLAGAMTTKQRSTQVEVESEPYRLAVARAILMKDELDRRLNTLGIVARALGSVPIEAMAPIKELVDAYDPRAIPFGDPIEQPKDESQ